MLFQIAEKVLSKAVLFLRAYRICDSLYIEEEINYLFNVFERLGYSKYFIDRAHRRAREKFYVPSNKDRENFDKVLLLPSNCNSNSAQSLFKQPPPKLVYKSDGTMREFLRHNCTKKSMSNGGVYAFQCKDCPKKYIGESDDIPRRLRTHRYEVRTNAMNNPLFKHISDFSHAINFDTCQTIAKIQSVTERKFVESLLIASVPNMNIYSKSVEMDEATKFLLFKHVPRLDLLRQKLEEMEHH